MSIKDRALARRKKVKTEAVPMPEWDTPGEAGSVVHVREMSAAERDAYEAAQVDASKSGTALVNFRAKLVCLTACDESGVRIFDDDAIDAVGELPAAEIRRLFDVASKLNALSTSEEKALEKNF